MAMCSFYWPFLSLIQVDVYVLLTFFIINTGQSIYIFNTNTGQCIFFNSNTVQCIFFLILIQVSVYFFNPVLVLKKYIHWLVLMIKRSIKNIHWPVL